MKIGTLMIEMAANVARLERDMRRATNTVDGAMNKIRRAASLAVKALGALGAGIGIAQFAQMVRQTSAMADEIDRFARLANTTTAEFQKISIAAQRFGVSQEKVADILKDVQDKVGDFLQTGAGPMVDFFEQIAPKVGVTAEQFRKLSGREALQLYVSSIEKANLSQSDMVFYMEAIASDSTLLLPLLKNNGKAYAEIASEAEKLGQVLSDEVIEANRQLNQDLMKLTAAFDGLKNQALAPIIKSLQGVASALTEMIANGSIQRGIEGIVLAFKALAIVLISRVVGALAATAAGMIKTATAMTALELALVAGAVKMKAFAVAANVAKGALAFIGGPVGVAVTAAAAIYSFAGRTDTAADSVIGLNRELAELDQRMRGLSNLELEQEMRDSAKAMRELEQERIAAAEALAQAQAAAMDPESQLVLGGQAEKEVARLARLYKIKEQAYVSAATQMAKNISEQAKLNNGTKDLSKSIQGVIDEYKNETKQLTKSNAEKEKAAFLQQLLNKGIKEGSDEWVRYVAEFSKAQSERQAIQKQIEDTERQKQVEADLQRQRIENEKELTRQKEIEAQKQENLIKERNAERLRQEEEFAREADQINEQIGQSLTDALMNGGRNAKDMLISLFRTLVLRPILQPIITGVTGALGLGTAGASLAGGTQDVASSGMDLLDMGSMLKTGYDVVAGGFASVGAAASSATKTLLGFEAAVASGAAAPGAQAAAAAQINSISASAATVGAAATVLAGVAAGVTAGTFISGDYKVFGDQMVSTGVGTAAGAIAGAIITGGNPIGAAIGAAIGGAIGGGINRAFGYGPQTTESAGIQGDLTTDGALVRQYAVMKKKGGWFRGDKNWAEYADLEKGALDSLSSMSIQVASSVALMADSLGLEVEKMKGVQRGFILETMGKTEEEITALIGEQMGYFADQLAETIEPAIWNFKRGSESASEILTRLSTNLTGVNSAFDLLGFKLYDTSLAGAEAAQGMVDLFGSLDQFNQSVAFYYDNFYSLQERYANQLSQTELIFEALDQTMPKTKEGFRALVDAAKAVGDDALVASLLQVAPAFNSLLDTFNAVLGEAVQGTDNAFKDLQDALGRQLEDAKKAAKETYDLTIKKLDDERQAALITQEIALETVSELTRLSDILKSSLDSLSGEASVASARNFISQALATAQSTGYLPNANELSSAISTATQATQNSGSYNSEFEQRLDQLRLRAELESLNEISDDQLTTAERELQAVNKLLENIDQQAIDAKTFYDQQLSNAQSQHDEQLQAAIDQINELRDINGGIKSLAEAMSELAAAIAAEASVRDSISPSTPGTSSRTSAVKDIYETVLEREADASGLDYWINHPGTIDEITAGIADSTENRVQDIEQAYIEHLGRAPDAAGFEYWTNNTSSLDDIIDSIANSPEAKGLHAYARGGFAQPGLALVGENGPELINFSRPAMVYTAGETQRMFNSGNDDDIKQEIKELRTESQANQQALVSMQYRMYQIFRRWDGDGLPEQRDVEGVAQC